MKKRTLQLVIEISTNVSKNLNYIAILKRDIIKIKIYVLHKQSVNILGSSCQTILFSGNLKTDLHVWVLHFL